MCFEKLREATVGVAKGNGVSLNARSYSCLSKSDNYFDLNKYANFETVGEINKGTICTRLKAGSEKCVRRLQKCSETVNMIT